MPAPDLWQAERVVLECEIGHSARDRGLVQSFCKKLSREATRLWRLPVVSAADAGLLDPLQDLRLQAQGRVVAAGEPRPKAVFTLRALRRGFPLDRTSQERHADLEGPGEEALQKEIAASLQELIAAPLAAPRAGGSVPPLPKAW